MAALNKAVGAGESDEDEEEGGSPQAGVTKGNYWRVIKLLEQVRKNKATYGSDKLVTLAEQSLVLNKRQFKVVLNNLDKLVNNADDFKGSLQSYMAKHNIVKYTKVPMSKFIKEVGW